MTLIFLFFPLFNNFILYKFQTMVYIPHIFLIERFILDSNRIQSSTHLNSFTLIIKVIRKQIFIQSSRSYYNFQILVSLYSIFYKSYQYIAINISFMSFIDDNNPIFSQISIFYHFSQKNFVQFKNNTALIIHFIIINRGLGS